MNPTKQPLSLSAIVLCASAVAPATGLAASPVERGRYSGTTSQPVTGGGKVIAFGPQLSSKRRFT